MDWIYLDNNATTQPAPQVVAAMQRVHEQTWANPSSVHRLGQLARHQVDLARAAVGRLLNCRDQELIFTSGGTEANNLALCGVLGPRTGGGAGGASKSMLISTEVEHPSVLDASKALAAEGIELTYLPIDLDGRVDPQTLADLLEQHAPVSKTILISIQWANNETGVIQPIAELAAVVQAHCEARSPGSAKVLLHVDATQAAGKIPIDVKAVPVDLLTFAAHKFYGPKGSGALYVRSGVRLRAQLVGGAQERQRRGGTENTAGIVGMATAADLAVEFLKNEGRIADLTALRDRLEHELPKLVDCDVVVNGAQLPDTQRLWNTSNLSFVCLQAEAILVGLSERGICASAGSACSSGSLEPSPVLVAMCVPEQAAHGAIRFSFGRDTTAGQIHRAIRTIQQVVNKLAGILPIRK